MSTPYKNTIQTWVQGRFIDQPKYKHWTQEQKQAADRAEKHLVRPSPTGNAICQCSNPDDAKWIAARLNLIAKLSQMVFSDLTDKITEE